MAPKWAAGIRFNGHWYCSRPCVENAARAGLDEPAIPAVSPSSLPPLKLGVLLRHLGAVSEADLESALASQRESGRRLGAELLERGLSSSEAILKALAAQAGVSYLAAFDVSRVTQGPSWLPTETVRALGLVPFDADETQRKLRVACTAPLPRSAMRALAKLTGWTAEPYLVEDEVWKQALRMYRPSQAPGHLRESVTVNGVDDAVAHIADSASVGRAVTMRAANWDRYTWVRVEGPRQVSDLLLPAIEEAACQAERIAR
jgi:hypothetical protein